MCEALGWLQNGVLLQYTPRPVPWAALRDYKRDFFAEPTFRMRFLLARENIGTGREMSVEDPDETGDGGKNWRNREWNLPDALNPFDNAFVDGPLLKREPTRKPR